MSFKCDKCNFVCSKQSDWSRHEKTRKHINNAETERAKTPMTYLCVSCNKEYLNRSSLWYHTKKCGNECKTEKVSNNTELEKAPYLDIINRLLTDNMELRNFIIEQSKMTADTVNKTTDTMNKVIEQNTDMMNKVLESSKTTVINQTNNQNNNQKFNINVFLNEQCKDAINFSDFIKNIEVSREDLENNAQLGFVNGVSKILIDSLKQLDRSERPIHCTDVKRETMYIKDDDKWNKEEDSSKLNKAIQEVTRKSMGTLMNWKEENPDYKDRDSEFSGRCIVIQQQSMAAHNRDTYFPKVIKALAKEVAVDK
jgi:hypothetical protein